MSHKNTESVSLTKQAEDQVKASGLEHKKAQVYFASYAPFMSMMDELEKEIDSLNSEDPGLEDSLKAREIRLRFVKEVRKPAERKKDELKQTLLQETNLIQSLYNLVKSVSELKEGHLEKIEKHVELKEQQRKAELEKERLEYLEPFGFDATGFNLKEMDAATFEMVLAGAKAKHAQKLEDELNAEKERIRLQTIERLKVERMEVLNSVWQFVPQENKINYAELEEAEFKKMLKAAKKLHSEHLAEIEALKEKERLIEEKTKLKNMNLAKLNNLYLYDFEKEVWVSKYSDKVLTEDNLSDASFNIDEIVLLAANKKSKIENELRMEQERQAEIARLEEEKKSNRVAELALLGYVYYPKTRVFIRQEDDARLTDEILTEDDGSYSEIIIQLQLEKKYKDEENRRLALLNPYAYLLKDSNYLKLTESEFDLFLQELKKVHLENLMKLEKEKKEAEEKLLAASMTDKELCVAYIEKLKAVAQPNVSTENAAKTLKSVNVLIGKIEAYVKESFEK